jgi:DNA mismatch endonuclease, patch repair protein
MDTLNKAQRSRNMAAIYSTNSKPEVFLRSLVHGLGARFRLHQGHLPGKPDLVLKRFNALIFMHGCFWHMHQCKRGSSTPRTNAAFWHTKRLGNTLRDKKVMRTLRCSWNVLVVWECETRNPERLKRRLVRFLKRCESSCSLQ